MPAQPALDGPCMIYYSGCYPVHPTSLFLLYSRPPACTPNQTAAPYIMYRDDRKAGPGPKTPIPIPASIRYSPTLPALRMYALQATVIRLTAFVVLAIGSLLRDKTHLSREAFAQFPAGLREGGTGVSHRGDTLFSLVHRSDSSSV